MESTKNFHPSTLIGESPNGKVFVGMSSIIFLMTWFSAADYFSAV